MLKRQLAACADSSAEIRQLTRLASQISGLPALHIENETKARIARDIGFAYHPGRKVMARTAEGFAVVSLAVMLALVQMAQPGSALFGVKKETSKAKAAITQNFPFVSHPDNLAPPEHSANSPLELNLKDGSGHDVSGSTKGLNTSQEIHNGGEDSSPAISSSSADSHIVDNSGPGSLSGGSESRSIDGSSASSNRGPSGGSGRMEGN